MLENIPFKKLVLLVFLIIFAGGTFVGTRWYMTPQIADLKRNVSQSTNQIATLKEDIVEIEEELALFDQRKHDYDQLQAAGFFQTQGRATLRDILAESQRVSGILGGDFDIGEPLCYLNKELADSKYVIIGSPMMITLDSYDDLKVYEFIDVFQKKLPGYAAFQHVNIKKEQDISPSLLQEIGSGAEVPLISADIAFEWYTIVERDGVLCSSM
jgi:hypothetical protein